MGSSKRKWESYRAHKWRDKNSQWWFLKTRFTPLFLKNPQKFLNFQAYIKGWIKINGFECLGRKGSLEDQQSWFELCEPMIKHRDIFNTLNTKNALLTFCFLSPSTGNDVFFETLRFVQSECWDHNFEANHWREEESNITAQKHNHSSKAHSSFHV